MLFVYWFSLHFLISISLIFNKRFTFYLSLLFFVLMSYLYISKNATVDLVVYFTQFSYQQAWFEPGWGYLSLALSKVFSGNPYRVHFTYQLISLLLIFFLSKKFFSEYSIPKKKYYFLIPAMSLTIYTIFYFLGSQNVLRQFLSSIICLYAFYYGLNNKWFLSLSLYLISITIHISSAILIPLYFILSIRTSQKMINYLLSFIGGLLLIFLMLSIFREHPAVETYITIQDAADYKSRITYFKFIVLSFSLFFTHFLFTNTQEFKFFIIKKFIEFRFAVYFFALPFAFFQFWDLWTRITLITYFIELMLMMLIVFFKASQKYRFTCALLVMSYGIAPNVMAILNSGRVY